MVWVLTSQTRVLHIVTVALMSHCGYLMDTQQYRMESSLERPALSGVISAAISGLFPSKSKPVQAIIMSMSWSVQLSAMQPTVQVIIFTWVLSTPSWCFCLCSLITIDPHFQMLAALTPALQPSHQRPSQQVIQHTIGLFCGLMYVMICVTEYILGGVCLSSESNMSQGSKLERQFSSNPFSVGLNSAQYNIYAKCTNYETSLIHQ